MTALAIGLALFFAMNIGASGAAATMGVAYGSGAVTRRVGLILAAVGVFAGAYLGGGEVVKTLGAGIVPSDLLTVQLVVIILLSATMTLFMANLLGIPLSTSEVTVGAVVGVGVAYQSLFVSNVLVIVSFWVIIPLIAFVMAWIGGRIIITLEKRDARWRGVGNGKWKKALMTAVIVMGVFEAFSAGMNNVANAVGPLVGAGLLSAESGIFWGGLFVSLGAIVLGGRVVETNGKKITNLTLLQGSYVSGTGGLLVTIASLFGLPVPLTQVTTTAIMGLGVAKRGFMQSEKRTVIKILKVWLVSPLISLVLSYTLVKLFIEPDLFVVVLLLSLLIATLGLKSLYQTVRAEKSVVNEDGSGI
jgi:sulfate permease